MTAVTALRIPRPVLAYLVLFAVMLGVCLVARAWTHAALTAACLVMAVLGVLACEESSASALRREIAHARREAYRSAVHDWAVDRRPDRAQIDAQFAALPGAAARNTGGYLYAVAFSTGMVKVGQTVEPRTRLNKHRRDAEAFGAEVTGLWLSPLHRNYQRNEILFIARCSRLGHRRKNEFFRTSLDAVVEIAAGLEMRGVTVGAAG